MERGGCGGGGGGEGSDMLFRKAIGLGGLGGCIGLVIGCLPIHC